MKTDFSIPRRQNFRGILVVFLMDLFKRIKQNVYVFLPLLSSEIRENYLDIVLIVLVLLLLLQLLYSYKSYLNFKFHVHEERFFLRQGVLNFTDTDIPFDRIQNININQNLIQQLLNVVGLEIETAGQKSAEIKIKALSREDALELKEILLKNRVEKQINSQIEEQDENESSKTETNKKLSILFNLDFFQLLKVGISSNYIKGLGLVLFFVSTIFQYLQEFFSNFYEINFENTYLSQSYETFAFVVGFTIFLLAATFIVTIGRTVFQYYDLKVTKVDKDYEVEYGLLKRINQVIKKSKVQVFEVEENPIKNLFKIKNVFISQASSQELQNKKKIGVVGISDENLNILFKSLFDLSYPQQFINIQSSMRLMFRLMIKYFVLCILIGLGTFLWIGLSYSLIFPLLLLGVFTFISYKAIQKSHIGVNENLIEIHSGAIHTNKKYIATHKVQSIAIKRNWFQQQNNHADLIIYTASGFEHINYLNYDEVVEVVNYLNFKVESSEMGWI
jgi:putative membrane protein